MLNRLASSALFFAVVLAGCSGESTAPKQTLTDVEKQQVKELNEQRQDEWGRPKKK